MRLKGILDLLSLKERREFNQIVIWLSVRVVFDIISLASLLPLVLSYFAPEILKESKLWLNILSSMGIKLERTTIALIVFTSLFFLLKSLYFYFIEKKKASFLTRVQHRLVVSVYSRMTDDYSSNTGQLLENTAQLPIKYVFQCLDTILRIIPNSITIILILVSLVLFQWKIFITICLVFTPMLGLYLLFLKRPIKKVEQSFSQLNPVFFQSIAEAFKGRVEIAIFEKLTYFRERVEASSSTLTQSTARLLTLTNSSASFLELIAIVSIGGFFFYVVNADLTNEESITILSVFILSIVKIIPSLNGIVSATTNLRAYIYTVDILKEVYEKKIFDSTKSSFEKQAIFKNRIEIKKVRLNYPKSDFELPEVSVVLEPSDKMAIIGESGSGKSSIIKLILKLVSVSSGYITIDGKALEDIHTDSWWKLIAYVPQSPFIFSGTLLENLVFDKKISEVEENEIIRLLHDLKLNSLLDTLPKGLYTQIEEKGDNLSNGQKQRIGIARAVLRDCPIYIFDEITNGLDDKTRVDVIDLMLKKHLKDRLCIFATHDPKIERECNKIINLSSYFNKT